MKNGRRRSELFIILPEKEGFNNGILKTEKAIQEVAPEVE